MQELEHILIARVTQLVDLRKLLNLKKVNRCSQSELRRLATMELYASARRCRRRTLVGYFGEVLGGCSGCDRCRR